MVRLLVLLILLISATALANPYRVGERSNRSFKTKYGGFITTWDGRVVIFPSHIGNNMYRWDAYLMRYENIKTNSLGEPNLEDPNIYSSLATLDSDGEFGAPENKLNAQFRMHLAVSPDTNFKQNPYPSDFHGNPVTDLNSPYKTYRMFLIGLVQKVKSYTPKKEIPGMLVQTTGQIITKNLGKADAEIISAKVLEEGKPVRTSSDGEPFFGFEPTLSNDGRLVMWGGHPINGGIHYIMYSFNPNPKNNLGWSKPRHLTELYWVHGPGSGKETMVDGVSFSDRYPIAKKQLRDAYGNYFQPTDGYPGAYPWLSLDNAELFCPTVSVFFAARRAAYTVIGALTDHTARHIEGGINVTRGNVTGKADVWTSQAEGKELEEKYQKLQDENGKPYGVNAFQRIMIAPLGQFPSMWNPFLENSATHALPFSQKKNTFGLILSHSDRYVEVSLPETTDKNFLLYLPMNEAISFNREYLRKTAKSAHVQDWHDIYSLATYDSLKTPDISGNFQTGILKQAQFPFEYFQATQKWKSNREVVDKTVGLEGNSIFFRSNSVVEVTLKESVLKEARDTQEFNISFFMRTYQDLKKETLFLWDNFLFAELEGNILALKAHNGKDWQVVRKIDTPLLKNQWQHISINSNGTRIQIYWNGYLIAEINTSLPTHLAQSSLWIGPVSSNSPSTSALYSVDEFSISKVARTLEEIRSFALWKKDLPQQKNISDSEAAIHLGKKLFHDPILSKDKSVSCATCHVPKNSFTDSMVLPRGIHNQVGIRNTPSLLNVAHLESFMWDGKATSLEEQALLPIQNPKEMGLEIAEALGRLEQKYGADFQNAFNEGPTSQNLGKALAAFQKTLQAPKTSLDLNKLNSLELEGRGLFMGKARCASCHQGSLFTDQQFHNVGLIFDPFKSEEIGRQHVTGRSSDLLKFRTPALRSVKNTAPYFHDGRFQTLEEVIDFYNKGGDTSENRAIEIQPLGLTPEEMQALKAFLESM